MAKHAHTHTEALYSAAQNSGRSSFYGMNGWGEDQKNFQKLLKNRPQRTKAKNGSLFFWCVNNVYSLDDDHQSLIPLSGTPHSFRHSMAGLNSKKPAPSHIGNVAPSNPHKRNIIVFRCTHTHTHSHTGPLLLFFSVHTFQHLNHGKPADRRQFHKNRLNGAPPLGVCNRRTVFCRLDGWKSKISATHMCWKGIVVSPFETRRSSRRWWWRYAVEICGDVGKVEALRMLVQWTHFRCGERAGRRACGQAIWQRFGVPSRRVNLCFFCKL